MNAKTVTKFKEKAILKGFKITTLGVNDYWTKDKNSKYLHSDTDSFYVLNNNKKVRIIILKISRNKKDKNYQKRISEMTSRFMKFFCHNRYDKKVTFILDDYNNENFTDIIDLLDNLNKLYNKDKNIEYKIVRSKNFNEYLEELKN